MSRGNSAFNLVAQFMGRQNTVPIPVPFVQLVGDYASAALLSQVIYWSDRTEDAEGWFYKSREEWAAELLLTEKQVRRCVAACGELIEVQRRGIPARNYYRPNREALIVALQELGASKTSPKGPTETEGQQEVTKRANKGDPKGPNGVAQKGQQDGREKGQLITEPTSEPTQSLKDKKHLAAGAAAHAPAQPEQATESKGSQAVTSQVHPSAGEGTQDTQPAAGEEVPPAPRRAAPSAARRLMEVWNAQRGPLPEVESLNDGRRKAIKKLLRDCGDDLDRAAAVLADAAREVAGDEFWVSRRYGFDNLVPGKVFQKAEAWHARVHRPAAGLPTAPAAAAPAARKDWVNHD